MRTKKEFKEFSSMVFEVNTMNNTMEKLLSEKPNDTQSKIDNIFRVHQLTFLDYNKTNNEPRKNVTKWVNAENQSQEFAFKIISESDPDEKNSVRNQVTILKEFQNWQNIIKFYGLTFDGNKWYLVTEWAEFGNLREFYTKYKKKFDLELKLRISHDVARGLNFLRSAEVNIYNYYLLG